MTVLFASYDFSRVHAQSLTHLDPEGETCDEEDSHASEKEHPRRKADVACEVFEVSGKADVGKCAPDNKGRNEDAHVAAQEETADVRRFGTLNLAQTYLAPATAYVVHGEAEKSHAGDDDGDYGEGCYHTCRTHIVGMQACNLVGEVGIFEVASSGHFLMYFLQIIHGLRFASGGDGDEPEIVRSGIAEEEDRRHVGLSEMSTSEIVGDSHYFVW